MTTAYVPVIPAFMSEGLCAQTDPEAFFPEKGKSGRDAKAVCQLCPVRVECLVYALDHDERYGVWGGTNPRQRDAMRGRRRH